MARLTIRIPVLNKDKVRAALAKGLKEAARQAISIVEHRTARGTDVSGSPFRPYSPGYALAKREAGKNVTTPDLTLSGEMLRRMRILRAEGLRIIIGFEGQHRVARLSPPSAKKRRRTVRKTTGTLPMATVVLANNRRRRFFGIERIEEINVLVAIANRVIAAELAKQSK